MAGPIDRLRRLVAGLVPSGSVLERTVKSGVWAMSLNVGDRVLKLALLVLVARLVGPEAIGLMGIALLGLSTLRRFSQLGLDEALIQNRDENVDQYLDTTLTLQTARGFLIASVLFLAAPAIADFLGEPRATTLLRVIGLSSLLMGMRNPGVVYLQKDLDFHSEFLFRLSGSVTQFVVGVGYALVSPSVWALVVAHLAARAVQLVVSYGIHDYRPWPAFDVDAAKELIGYGKWITGGAVVYFLYSEGDDAVVAWLLSATALGFYRTAYQVANAPATEVSEVIRKVTFPAYSKLQDDIASLREGFFRTFEVTSLVSVPMAVGTAAVAPTFVRAVFGADWTPMVSTMRILAAYGLLLSLTATFSPVWDALGRPDYSTKLGALRVVLLAVFIIPVTTRFGVDGTALLVVGIYVFPMLPLDTYLLVESIDGSYRRLVSVVAYPAVASAVMGVAVLAAQAELVLRPFAVELGVLVLFGAVVYAGVAAALDAAFDIGLERNVKTVVRAVG